MKSHYRVVVIGGGVVGCSVLYHLAKLGWADIALMERSVLTSGSSWHAAGGFHALNADPNIAALQDYTIKLYKEIQAESGQDIGLHMTGGINVASAPERWEWLKAAYRIFQTMGIETARLVTPDEIKDRCPIMDVSGVLGGLYDVNEGHLDTYGAVYAYAGAARKRGAEIFERNRVLELQAKAGGSWEVVTEKGTIVAEHVVNCGGLWAKQVGLMAGIDLPVTPMEHHYLLTETIPEVAAMDRELPLMVDLEGFTYMRQEGKGILLGIYETNYKHWHMEGAPWDYGIELNQEDIDRIGPELEMGFRRFPCLERTGIKKWVNGSFTFTPDGNPLVGPIAGVPNYWAACGVMAGFLQGGGVGLSLAQWMIEGEPGADIYGMDIARYGKFAANREYLKQTTGQFYSRRFVMTYPNEQLPAGRALRTAPAYEAMTGNGSRWGVSWGLEVPIYFAPSTNFVENPTLKRSNAHDIVGAECRRVREGVGLLDISGFSRYEVTGPKAGAWLDHVLASRIPAPGRAALAPMLSPSGKLKGDLSVFNWGDGNYWIMGSYYLRQWHMRWFAGLLQDGVAVRDISDDWVGFSLAGPRSRDVLAAVVRNADVSNTALRFMSCREMDVGMCRAKVGRLSVSGELGFEINVPAAEHLTLYRTLKQVGAAHGMHEYGFNALLSLRMEKSFGIWSREFTQAYTPGMTGLDRWIAFDKVEFIGREAVLRERDVEAAPRRLVTLDIAADDADASGYEPVWHKGNRVGYVTSGAYGHCLGKSLALALVDKHLCNPGTELSVHVVGVERKAQVIAPSPHDPAGRRMRA
ncbi:MAG: GcvT family protein [Proteobacteria bacterium]|nr:GcvT family protein [Pseudomonadota bacterium]MBI3499224.1 GcvT family protein [Pseudomonadota bacterium]